MEEEELAELRMQQRQFEELRNAELVEQQRLEEQERRHREEKVGIYIVAIKLYYKYNIRYSNDNIIIFYKYYYNSRK